MSWCDRAVEELAGQPCCGYHADTAPATEPTALTVLALCAAGVWEIARSGAEWLVQQQAADGSLGARSGMAASPWSTALALLAWQACDRQRSPGAPPFFGTQSAHAFAWITSLESEPLPAANTLGHDSRLIAWPWIEGTHAWVEPTAMCVSALKACGQSHHPRVREAIRLLIDRQLPQGGCNYGNTVVLGTTLRAHLQPTGLALLALAGEPLQDSRVERGLDHLSCHVGETTTPLSLGWSLLGLCAHGRRPARATEWLSQAVERNWRFGGSPWKTALLCLAWHADHSLFVNGGHPHSLAKS